MAFEDKKLESHTENGVYVSPCVLCVSECLSSTPKTDSLGGDGKGRERRQREVEKRKKERNFSRSIKETLRPALERDRIVCAMLYFGGPFMKLLFPLSAENHFSG